MASPNQADNQAVIIFSRASAYKKAYLQMQRKLAPAISTNLRKKTVC